MTPSKDLHIVSAIARRAVDERTLLDQVCRTLVEIGGYRMAWAGYVESDDSKTVRPVAHAGAEEDYLAAVQFTGVDTPAGDASTARAIRENVPVVARRVRAEAATRPSADDAAGRGYASSIALPLRTNDGVVGVLSLHAAEEDAFDEGETRALAEVAEELSFGIASLRSRAERSSLQAALRRSEGWLRAAVHGGLDALLLLRPVHDAAGTVTDFELLDVNARAEALLHTSRSKIVGRRLSKVLHAHYRELISRYAAVLDSGQASEEQFSLVAPSGRTFWVRHRVTLIEEGVAVLWRDVTAEVEALRLGRANETKYRELLESLQEGIWATDIEARTIFVNLPMARMLGYTPEEMQGRPIFEFVSEALVAPLHERYARRAQGTRERYEFEFRHRNGEPVYLDLEAGPRYDEMGRFTGTIVGVMDITERMRTQEQLRDSVARLQKAEELAALGSWSYDPARETFFFGSPGLRRLLGLRSGTDEFSVQTMLELFPAEERVRVKQGVDAMHRGETQHNEHRFVTASGEERILFFHSQSVFDAGGWLVRVDGFAQDVTERKRYEARLEHLATHDVLTDLPNRRVLEDRFAQSIVHLARSPGEFLAILYIDLDDFKLVNDRLGHAFGDELLQVVAHVLRSTVREGDTVARQGGDEFIVLLRNIREPTDVAAVAEKIAKSFEQPVFIRGQELRVSCSIGASIYPTDGEEVATLLKNADAAMYLAKRARNGIRFHACASSEQVGAAETHSEISRRRACRH